MSTSIGNLPKHLKAQLEKQIQEIGNVPGDSSRFYTPDALDMWAPVRDKETGEIRGHKARSVPGEWPS